MADTTNLAPALLARLREDPTHLESLFDAGLEFALDRPLSEWVDRDVVVERIASAVRAVASADGFDAWLATRMERGLEPLDRHRGALGERIPMTALAPLERALSHEVAPDPRLVRALLDHASLRALMRDILSANLTEFAKRLRESMPVPGGAASRGLGRAFAGVAKGMASAAGAAVEKGLEERVRTFVDDAIGVSLETTIERFCGPTHQREMAQWRVDVLHALLQQPVERIVAERHKVPPQRVAADFVAVLETFASWSELPSAIEEALSGVLWREGDPPTARAWLEGSGLLDDVTRDLRAQIVSDLSAFVQTEAFATWLHGLVDA